MSPRISQGLPSTRPSEDPLARFTDPNWKNPVKSTVNYDPKTGAINVTVKGGKPRPQTQHPDNTAQNGINKARSIANPTGNRDIGQEINKDNQRIKQAEQAAKARQNQPSAPTQPTVAQPTVAVPPSKPGPQYDAKKHALFPLKLKSENNLIDHGQVKFNTSDGKTIVATLQNCFDKQSKRHVGFVVTNLEQQDADGKTLGKRATSQLLSDTNGKPIIDFNAAKTRAEQLVQFGGFGSYPVTTGREFPGTGSPQQRLDAMSDIDKCMYLMQVTADNAPEHVKNELKALMSWQTVATVAVFAGLMAGGPIGVGIAVGLGIAMFGKDVWDTFEKFFASLGEAFNTNDPAAFRKASEGVSEALTHGGIQIISALVTHRLSKPIQALKTKYIPTKAVAIGSADLHLKTLYLKTVTDLFKNGKVPASKLKDATFYADNAFGKFKQTLASEKKTGQGPSQVPDGVSPQELAYHQQRKEAQAALQKPSASPRPHAGVPDKPSQTPSKPTPKLVEPITSTPQQLLSSLKGKPFERQLTDVKNWVKRASNEQINALEKVLMASEAGKKIWKHKEVAGSPQGEAFKRRAELKNANDTGITSVSGEYPVQASAAGAGNSQTDKYPKRPDPWDAKRAPPPNKPEYDEFMKSYEVTWGRGDNVDALPRLMFTKPNERGVVTVDYFYKDQGITEMPTLTGGQMIADSFKLVNIKPAGIHIASIENRPTIEALRRGEHPSTTVFGQTLSNAARELGGTPGRWRIGGDLGSPGRPGSIDNMPYVELEIIYPKPAVPVTKPQPLLPAAKAKEQKLLAPAKETNNISAQENNADIWTKYNATERLGTKTMPASVLENYRNTLNKNSADNLVGSSGRVIEIGPGQGEIVRGILAAEPNVKVVGIDIDTANLQRLEKSIPQNHRSRYQSIDGGVQKAAFGENNTNLVIAERLFPHLNDAGVSLVLKKSHKALKEDGIVMCDFFTTDHMYANQNPAIKYRTIEQTRDLVKKDFVIIKEEIDRGGMVKYTLGKRAAPIPTDL